MGTRRSRHNKGRKPLYKEHDAACDVQTCERCGIPSVSGQCRSCYERNSAFLDGSPAKSLRLEDIDRLSEPMAREVFKQVRWHKTDGQPQCPSCDGLHLYRITRPSGSERWRCVDCGTDFSSTSGTPFRNRKLTFKGILATIATIAGQNGNIRASTLKTAVGYGQRSTVAMKARLLSLREHQLPTFELGKSRFMGDSWMATRTWWSEPEKAALAKFAAANADPELAANALGRSPQSIINYSRELKIKLPPLWGGRQPRVLRPRVERAPKIVLQFPYIQKQRSEHADLLAVNDLIPKNLPSYIRADIVQEILLAILEGRVTIEQIASNKDKRQWFVSQFYKNNYEQSGHAVSMSGFEDDDRSYDEIASSIAAQEWRTEQMNEKRRSFDSLSSTFYAPTQIEDTFDRQVLDRQFEAHVKKNFLSFDEVEAEMQTV